MRDSYGGIRPDPVLKVDFNPLLSTTQVPVPGIRVSFVKALDSFLKTYGEEGVFGLISHNATGPYFIDIFYQVVDHIIQVSAGGAQYDERNFMSMCKRCHDRKSNLEGRNKFDDLPFVLNGYKEKIPTQEAVDMVLERLISDKGGV